MWEHIIRSARKILRALLREQSVSGEALRTLMAEVGSILNSRPLTPNSDNPADPEPFTSNHQLLPRSNLNLPPGVFVKGNVYCRNRWRLAQYLTDVSWKRCLSSDCQNTCLHYKKVGSGQSRVGTSQLETWFSLQTREFTAVSGRWAVLTSQGEMDSQDQLKLRKKLQC